MSDTKAPSSAATTAWHALAPEEALAQQKVDPEVGLAAAEIDARRATFGPNKFAEAAKEPVWQRFLRQYRDPMQIVLLAAGGVSLFLPGQFMTGVLLILLTLFNAWLGLSQEGKAEASVAALQKMMIVKARVRRGGEVAQVPMEELVPGDIVMIEAGDLVPADGRIIRAATLEIDESALTGESAPVPKQLDAVAADAALGDRVDIAFMNTQVTRGAGTIVVTSTGMATEVGHISGMLQGQVAEKTPLTKQLNVLTNQILIIAGVVADHLDGTWLLAERAVRHAVPDRGRLLGVGDPDRPAGGRHGGARCRHLHPGQGRRDREAAAVGRDARLDVRHQLRQDGHPHAQPDDRGRDDGRRASVQHHR